MEALIAIIELDRFSLKDRLRFLFRGTIRIRIEPNEEIDGYDIHYVIGRKRQDKLPAGLEDLQDEMNY